MAHACAANTATGAHSRTAPSEKHIRTTGRSGRRTVGLSRTGSPSMPAFVRARTRSELHGRCRHQVRFWRQDCAARWLRLRRHGRCQVESVRQFGWFYDMMKLSLPIMSLGGVKSRGWFYTLDTYDLSQITCNPPTSSHSGQCGPGNVIESIDFAFDSSVADPRLADYFGGQPHNTVDPDMKPYKMDELTVGLDHELNRTMSVGVRVTEEPHLCRRGCGPQVVANREQPYRDGGVPHLEPWLWPQPGFLKSRLSLVQDPPRPA